MPDNLTLSVKVRGDADELSKALSQSEKELQDLNKTANAIKVLEGAAADVKRFEGEIQAAQIKVKALQTALSEAMAADADAPQLKKLNTELANAERAAKKAEDALLKGQTAVVKLNLAAGEAGVTTSNLAAKKTQLATETARLTGVIGQQKTAIETLDASEKRAAASASQLNAAFSNLGIRSAAQIEADIQAINQDLLKLASNTKLSGSEFDRAFAAGQVELKKLHAELNGAATNIDIVSNRTGGLISAMGKLGLAFSGVELARQFITVNIELENIERTFAALTGSSAAAAKELDFVRGVADRLGIDTISAAKAFSQLSAATKGTGVEGKTTREVFEAVARSMSIAGKSSADTEGALQALAQMASKGVISMEELRGQLGERLPGSLQAAAKGLGLTNEELIALVESGKLTADEFFPGLKRGLEGMYGDSTKAAGATETLAQEIAHAKNTVNDLFKSMGDSGIIAGMSGALEGLGAAAIITANVLVTLGKTIGTFFGALANGDIGLRGFSATAKQAFAEIEKEAFDKIIKAAMHNKVLEATLDEAGKKALAAARANKENADAAEEGGKKAVAVSADWTKLNVAYGALEKSTEAAAKQAVANAEAKQAETAASVALANAFGTEAEKLAANAVAAKTNADATAVVAERKKELFAVAQANLEALQREAEAQGGATQSQQKVIDSLVKTVEARQADAAKAIAQADATRLAAVQSDAAAASYADNSARLGELKIAYEQATIAVDALRQAKAAGKDVTVQLSAAELEAAKAAALYRDAVSDQIDKINALASAKRGEIDLASANVRLAIEEQKTILAVAQAKGDETAAARALIEIKRLEIELAELVAQAKRAEADAAILLVQAKREEAVATGTLTAAKEAEFKAIEAGARVKQVEASIAEETAKRLRELSDATRESGAAADGASGGYDKAATSLDRVATSAGKARSALASYQDMVDAGMSQAEISNVLSDRQTSDAEKAAGIVKRNVSTDSIDWRTEALRKGATSAEADEVAKNIGDKITREMAVIQQKSAALPGFAMDPSSYRTEYSGAMNRAFTQALDEARGGGLTTVNINLNNKSSTVKVASAADANTLTAIFKQIETDAGRAY